MPVIQYYGPGNWGGLPEFGITELFGGNTGSLGTGGSSGGNTGGSSGGSGGISNTGGDTTDYTNLLTPTGSVPNITGGIDLVINDAISQEEQRARDEERARQEMLDKARDAYDPFFAELLRQEQQIPTIQQDYMNVMNTGYNNQVGAVNRGVTAGMAQANASQNTVKQNQATSLRDLAMNLSNAVNAFGQRLGQVGGGDSSAANMANYAYSKIANRNTADVMSQVRGQLAEIEGAKQKIVTDAQDKLGTLQTWKATQTLAIQNYIRSLQDYIAQARAQGKESMAQNEVDAIREGFSRAMERIQQINDLAVSSKLAIIQNAQTALAESTAFSQNLTNMGNTNPADITQQGVDSGTIESGGTSSNLIPGTITEEKDKSLTDLLYSA